MTNGLSMNITDGLKAAQRLSEQGDRYAFFTLLIFGALIMGFGVAWAARYFTGQNEKLVNALTQSHTAFQGELKDIVAKNHTVIEENTRATVQQTELNRTNNETLRAVAAELELHRRGREHRAG